jgi:predicted Zn-dependent protease
VEATGGVISYETVTDPALADITFRLGTPPSGLKGITNLDFDPDTRELLHVEVVLLQSAPGETYPTGIDLLALYTAHEFGHALGITASAEAGSGHSTDPKDTMFPALNPSEPFITERDINTLENIYPGLFGGGAVSASGTRVTRGAKGTGRTARMTVQCP